MQVGDIVKLLSAVPVDVLVAVYELVREVLASDDPKRTAIRHAEMIAAKKASEAALGEILK